MSSNRNRIANAKSRFSNLPELSEARDVKRESRSSAAGRIDAVSDLENVGQQAVKNSAYAKPASACGTDDNAACDELLQEAAEKLESANSELESANSKIDSLKSENEIIKYRLGATRCWTEVLTSSNDNMLTDQMKEAFKATSPKLEQVLLFLKTFYADRLVILETAYSSAKESDRCKFKYVDKALEMLVTLAEAYWADMEQGNSERQLKDIFGHECFSAKENSDTISPTGIKRRKFRYKKDDILMEKHLKIGNSPSRAETIRIHFEWIPDEKRVLIGHCGKHLEY
jgi:hypothetical protein